MLDAIRGATRTICFETYIYWSGSIGREFAEALIERARAGVQGPRAAGLGGHGQDGRVDDRGDEAGGRRGGEIPSAPLVQPRAAQQPDPPQAAGRGRHRSASPAAWASRTTGSATPRTRSTGATRTSGWRGRRWRRCRPPSWTTGSRPRPGAARRGVLSRRSSRRAHAAQVFKSSADEAQRERAAHVPALDRLGGKSMRSPTPTSCPTTLAVATLVAAQRRGVQVEIIVPGRHIDTEDRPPGVALALGAAAGGRESRSTSTSRPCTTARSMVVDEVWTSVGLDQLRQPLVPAERRGEPQRSRRRLRRGSGDGVREGQVEGPEDHAGGVASPSLARARHRATCRASSTAALSGQ